PLGTPGSWLAGADVNLKTSHFRGNQNFAVGLWGLATGRRELTGDKTAAGLLVDYPNDLLDVSLSAKRIGDGFQPSLGFVPRTGIYTYNLGADYKPRPNWSRFRVRQMFYEQRYSLVTDLQGRWESYRVFWAPVNWRLESGDRFEFNVVPTGEQLPAAFVL